MIFVDTNVLLRFVSLGAPEHPKVRRAIENLNAQKEPLAVSSQVVAEFWVVATRPEQMNGFGWSPAETHRTLTALLSHFQVLPEQPDTLSHWLALASQCGVRGKRAHDARIVAIMQSHGITRLLTLNPADFQSLGIETVVPA
jgi:predicted nucleic acid-binding protein